MNKESRRLIILVVVFALFFGICAVFSPYIFAAEREHTINELLSSMPLENIGYYYPNSQPIESHQFSSIYYSDALLLQDAREFSPEIAKASVALAMAAYSQDSVVELLNQMGTDGYEFLCEDNANVYYRSAELLTLEDNDYVAYTIAHKKIKHPFTGEDYFIYCVPIQGTTRNAEWFSNFNLGTYDHHAGFARASLEVYNKLVEVINECEKSEPNAVDPDHRIVWITGHSRGAACANLIAGWLSQEGQEYTTPEHVFGYTYACPAVSLKADKSLTNIYNFNNPSDLVAMVPMESWGYQRNGVDIELNATDTYFENFRQRFLSVTGSEYAGMQSGTVYDDLLLKAFGNDRSFYLDNESVRMMMDIVAWVLGGQEDVPEVVSVVEKHMGHWTGFTDVLEEFHGFIGDVGDLVAHLGMRTAELDIIAERAYRMYQETKDMTAEEFACYIQDAEKLQHIVAMEELNIITIDDPQDFLTIYETLNVKSYNLLNIRDVLADIAYLFIDGEGNPLSGIMHSHTQATYVNWINAMYYGDSGWAYSNNLKQLTVTDTYLSIGEGCFYGSTGLEELIIASPDVTIGSCAFGECDALHTVTLPVDADFTNDPFSGTSNVTTIHYTYGKDGVMPNYTLIWGQEECAYIYTLQYYSREKLKYVDFEEGITHIGDFAFYCSYDPYEYGDMFSVLSEVKLPSTLKSIGWYAFCNNDQLTEINLPEGLTCLAEGCFAGCDGFTELPKIPSTLTALPISCFEDCDGLISVAVPETLQSIGERALASCAKLTELTIPDSKITLDYYAFGGNEALSTVSLPVDVDISNDPFQGTCSVETIYYTYGTNGVMPDYCGVVDEEDKYSYQFSLQFHSRKTLKTVRFAEGITRIGNYAFLNLDYYQESVSALQNVILPSSIKSIGDLAFYDNDSILSIVLPEGLTTLGYACFENCDGLGEMPILPSTLTELPGSCFAGCEGLVEVCIPATLKKIGEYAFACCSNLTELTLPGAKLELGYYAFGGNEKLHTVTLPVDTDYSCDPFQGTCNVETIYYTCGANGIMPDYRAYWEEIDLCSYANTLQYNSRHNLREVCFAEGVTRIGNYAFYYPYYEYDERISALTDVKLPSTLKSIGDYAFYDNDNLLNIVLPEGITWLGDCCFNDCDGFADIPQLPSTLKELSAYCFAYCDGITDLHIPNTLEHIDDGAFACCANLCVLTLPDDKISLGYFAFGGNATLRTVTLPVDVDCSNDPFQGSCNVETIYYTCGEDGIMPDYRIYWDEPGLYLQANTLQYHCRAALKTVVFAEGVKKIGKYAFYCPDYDTLSVLQNLDLPSSLEHIGAYAFYGNTCLQSICLPAGVKSIGDFAYAYCEGIQVVEFLGAAPEFGGDCIFLFVSAVMYYPLEDESWSGEVRLDYGGELIWAGETVSGDVDDDGDVDSDDAIYLLYHTFLPEEYAINQSGDMDGDGDVDSDDAIYLLYHTFLPEEYPLL